MCDSEFLEIYLMECGGISIAMLNRKIRLKLSEMGVPWWLSGVRILCCHCCGSGYCHGVVLNSGPGTSVYLKCVQEKTKQNKTFRDRADFTMVRNIKT